MADNKNDKPKEKNTSLLDSDEYLRSVFSEELKAIVAEEEEGWAPETRIEKSADKKPKPGSQVEGVGRRKLDPEITTGGTKTEKNSSISEVQVSAPSKAMSGINRLSKNAVKEKTAPQVKADTNEEIRPDEENEITKVKVGKIRFGRDLPVTLNKAKVALLSVLLIASITFLFSSLGIVDFGQILGLSEPTRKMNTVAHVAKKRPTAPIPEKRPPTRPSSPVRPVKKSMVVKDTPEPVTSKAPQTPAAKSIAGSEKAEPMLSTKESAPEKTPRQTASLKGPAREMPPPKWVEGVYPYSVYLGSFRTPERLQKAATVYGIMGLSPYWIQVDLGEKGRWFRLFTGFFRTRGEADAFIRENQIPGAFSRHTKYTVLIRTYTSEKELSTKRMELRALACSSYKIKDRNGVFGLFSGAFYQRARAQKHKADLESKGIQGEVFER